MANSSIQPQVPADKSLQININSEDDAKAVIQHLGKIKATFQTLQDSVGITSVEFCIAESIRRKVDGFLIGAIPWCRTYVKSVAPFEGNVHFPLPHFNPGPPNLKRPEPRAQKQPEPESVPATPPAKQNRYLKNLPDSSALDATPGKTSRPVPATVAGA